MSELQSTIEFSVELYKFYNVDLFQRGMYQVRCSLRVSSKFNVEVEVTTPEVSTGLGSAIILGNYGACRPFQILYRNEEVNLKDLVLFRCHMLVDGHNLKESLERADFALILELWFSDTSPVSMVMVSSRTLQLNMSPVEGLHYHLPVLFDYFHLSAISVTIHAALTALHQPSIKRGILRYMQSCAPKSSKSWSKIRSAHCTSLTDPVLPVSSHKIYSRINESPQIHLEAYNVLLDASNNLKSTINEYKALLMQREETISENYDTLVIKPSKYENRRPSKKDPFSIVPNSSLAERCADNIRLWNHFLLNFSCKSAIQQYLCKYHHTLRVRRFAELFFIIYNPRSSALACYDTTYHNYLLISEIARRSKYLHNLPPLPVHCVALDGDSATMPIIFEDQYQRSFDYEKRNCESKTTQNKDFNSLRIPKTIDETQCSCGIGNLYREMRKSSEKTLVNLDLFNYEDPLINFPVPTRHSKSLDQLQMCSKNRFHYSLNNILNQNEYISNVYGNKSSNYYYSTERALKNVASEHNMRSQRKYRLDNGENSSICNCAAAATYNYNNSININTKKSKKLLSTDDGDLTVTPHLEDSSIDLKENNVISLDRKYKQFNIKNLTNVKEHCQKLVKSISHTSTDSTQNIFRTNSMQFFSPKKKALNGINKFNSLLTTKKQSKRKSIINGDDATYSGDYLNGHLIINNQKKTKSKKHLVTKSKNRLVESSKKFDIGSTSSSTESLSICKKNTGLNNMTSSALIISNKNNSINLVKMRKVKSTSCIGEEPIVSILSGTESLPNITNPKTEEQQLRLNYVDIKCYSSNNSSSSSTTSEQSGWITSRSSSIASSTEVNNPATNIDNIQKRLLSLSEEAKKIRKGMKLDESSFKIKPHNKYCLDSDSSNGHIKKNQKFDRDFPLFKGCEINQSNICEDIALPPPKQFRDLESPSSSVVNGTNEEEINAVDNILYHVVDTTTTLDLKPSTYSTKTLKETIDTSMYKGSFLESHKAFLKAKNEFKSQLNFPGFLYSDLNSFASTVPYFHISDEFRIFSPEGMHLIVCVHGLDGNSADLRLVKTYLELGLPGAYLDFLMSERNQGDTFSDFETMTDRLISEILHYLDSSSISPTRISFVGHSLGNIIIRSALTRPQMKFLLPRLHTFLSLSGPHLGTLYNSSGLVNMGMWFMQKWKKSGSLLQLCMKDSSDVRQTFLYRLSQRSTLQHFRNVLLCGSGQDRYVPLHSARIELCKDAMKDASDQGAIYREMVHNIMSPIIAQKDVTLVRYDIHHALPNTANALIGRAAHIAVLDSELFIEKFMAVVGIKYFR